MATPLSPDPLHPCSVRLPTPDECCVSPCEPPWRTDHQCLLWYETKYFRAPLGKDRGNLASFINVAREYIEFRITYEHRLCLLGKQHGPLLYTVTLLPGEKVTLYHSDRYRRISSHQESYSVQSTFMQFLSVVHQARATNSMHLLNDSLASSKTSGTVSAGGGLGGLLGLPSGSASTQLSVSDHNLLEVSAVSDQFNQSVAQASQLTHAERSVVISTYEDKESLDVTARHIQNDNDCRAVTYFVRKIVELYAISTVVSDVSFRIVAPSLPPDWHSLGDTAWLPKAVQDEIKAVSLLLPKIGELSEKPRPISLPTDGTVYDPELAHCCSCEPERKAAITLQLDKQKADAMKACLEAQMMEVELQRRKLLLEKGDLSPFDPPPSPEA